MLVIIYKALNERGWNRYEFSFLHLPYILEMDLSALFTFTPESLDFNYIAWTWEFLCCGCSVVCQDLLSCPSQKSIIFSLIDEIYHIWICFVVVCMICWKKASFFNGQDINSLTARGSLAKIPPPRPEIGRFLPYFKNIDKYKEWNKLTSLLVFFSYLLLLSSTSVQKFFWVW
jgi:hypothetical protein